MLFLIHCDRLFAGPAYIGYFGAGKKCLQWGHWRGLERQAVTSGLPSTPDIRGLRRHVSTVP